MDKDFLYMATPLLEVSGRNFKTNYMYVINDAIYGNMSVFIRTQGLGNTGCCGASYFGTSFVTTSSLLKLIQHGRKSIFRLEAWSNQFYLSYECKIPFIVDSINKKFSKMFVVHAYPQNADDYLIVVEIKNREKYSEWQDSVLPQ